MLGEQRREWLDLIDRLNHRIARVDSEVEQAGEADSRVRLLRTHYGIGPLTALALAHTLEPVTRFATSRKVTACVGLEPCEDSSADRVRWHGISQAGPPLLRFLLIEAAGVAIRYDAPPDDLHLRRHAGRGADTQSRPDRIAVFEIPLDELFIDDR